MSITELVRLLTEDIFFTAAGVLILGFILGRLVKFLKMPRVTGYIIAGIVFGPYILKILNENSVAQLDFIPRFALGIIALVKLNSKK